MVAWFDHFVFSEGGPPSLAGCHSLDTGVSDARLCRVEDGIADYQCVEKPPNIDACSDCDLNCMVAGVRDRIVADNLCLHLPTDLRCGPNPDESDGCCYVVRTEDTATCPAD